MIGRISCMPFYNLSSAFVVTLLLSSKKRRIWRELLRSRLEIREQYLSKLVIGNDTTSINMVCMKKPMF